LGAVAPFTAEGLDWFAGVDPANIADFQLLTKDPAAWRTKMARAVEEVRDISQEAFDKSAIDSAPDADRAVLTPELLAFGRAQMRDGLAPGPDGFIDDNLSDIPPWGFEPGSIKVPLQLWHGMDDSIVPLSHAKWLAAHLPGAEVHLEPGEGHVSLFARRIPEVQAWLVSHF
jgi:pimeloyl-ACP methyl ester carboxylesterase